MSLISELKRRNVFRVATAYVVVAWLLIQVAETLFPLFGFDETPARIVVIVLAIGFVPAVALAWVFELTPEGLKREKDVDRSQSISGTTANTLDRIIIVVLAVAVGYFAFDKFVLSETREADIAEHARQQGRSQALVESYGEKSIAVLAFDDMSPEKDQEYLSDGIAEELLNLLAKIPDLRVISRSSAFSYKGSNIRLDQIADELNVAHILEGSVRKAGNRVRITAQLIEARSDTHLWSETYDRTLEDIFAIQDEIAEMVVQQLKITLLGQAPTVFETDPELYTLYLQGRHLRRQHSAESLSQAQTFLEQVWAADPAFMPAIDDLISVYINQAHTQQRDFNEGYELAGELARQGLESNPDYGRLYAQLGWIDMYYRNDMQAAATSFERGLALAPDDAAMLGDTATMLYLLGRSEEAVRLTDRVAQMDPLNTVSWLNKSILLASAAKWDESVSALRTALRLSPDMSDGHYLLALSLLGSGAADEALREIELEPVAERRLLGKAMIYPALGRARLADQALAELIESGASPLGIAEVLATREEIDKSFEWLEKAEEVASPDLAEVHVNPRLVNLRSDPRWERLLERLGKSPATLESVEFELPVQNP